MPRIGVMTAGALSSVEEGLRDGLRELGYVDGKNIIIDWRRSLGTDKELRLLASELAGAKAQVIVTASTSAARVLLQTTTVSVVFIAGDPVGTGLAASTARPGGRGTGVSMLNRELTGKRMELLRQLAPGMRRIFFLTNPSNPLDTRMLEEAQAAARTLGVKLETLNARNADEIDAAFRSLPGTSGDGIVVSPELLFVQNKVKVAQAVRKARLVAIFPYKENHEDGVLMSYGANVTEAGRRTAVYVDRILKGANPAELPIEQLSKYELVIDLRVARAMGIDVPQDLLLRADEVMR